MAIVETSKVTFSTKITTNRGLIGFKITNSLLNVMDISIWRRHAINLPSIKVVFSTRDRVGRSMEWRGIRRGIPSSKVMTTSII